MSYRALYNVPAGSELRINRTLWQVALSTETHLELEGAGGEIIQETRENIDRFIKNGKCDVATPSERLELERLRKHTGGICYYDQLNEKQKKEVDDRRTIVEAILSLARNGHKITQRFFNSTDNIGLLLTEMVRILTPQCKSKVEAKAKAQSIPLHKGRTLLKILDRYVRNNHNKIFLLSLDHKKGNRTARMTALQSEALNYIERHVLDPKKPNISAIYRSARVKLLNSSTFCHLADNFPSLTTVRKKFGSLAKSTKRFLIDGKQHAINTIAAGKTRTHAHFYGERVEIDEVCLSIFILKDKSYSVNFSSLNNQDLPRDGKEVMRCWLTVMIDVATRMILAWSMSETPSSNITISALRMAGRDKERELKRYGCKQLAPPAVHCQTVISDNGTALRNGRTRAAYMGIGSTAIDGRTHRATDKAHMERFFRTLEMGLISQLKGYVGSHPKHLTGYDAKGETCLSADQLYGMITRYIIDEYHHMPHRGAGLDGQTPWDKLTEVLQNGPAISPPNYRDRCLHLGERFSATVTSEGVKPRGVPYNSSELQKWADRQVDKKVTVHIDPDFLGTAYVTSEHDTAIISVNLSRSEWEDSTLSAVIEELKRKRLLGMRGQSPETIANREAAQLRRIQEMGTFADPDLPESWLLDTQLKDPALEALLVVEAEPAPFHYNRIDPMDFPTSIKIQLHDRVQQPTDEPRSEGHRGRTYSKVERKRDE